MRNGDNAAYIFAVFYTTVRTPSRLDSKPIVLNAEAHGRSTASSIDQRFLSMPTIVGERLRNADSANFRLR